MRLEVSFPPIPLVDCGGKMRSTKNSRPVGYSKQSTNRRLVQRE
jgi:hypothetical protein